MTKPSQPTNLDLHWTLLGLVFVQLFTLALLAKQCSRARFLEVQNLELHESNLEMATEREAVRQEALRTGNTEL